MVTAAFKNPAPPVIVEMTATEALLLRQFFGTLSRSSVRASIGNRGYDAEAIHGVTGAVYNALKALNLTDPDADV
jgi:hypothetical protein